MRQRNRTSSSSAHSANAALNAKITNSSRLADYLPKVLVFQKLSTLGQKPRHPLQSHANQPTYLPRPRSLSIGSRADGGTSRRSHSCGLRLPTELERVTLSVQDAIITL